MIVACAYGEFDLCPGQEFVLPEFAGSPRYRVERFLSTSVYSPSGVGGTSVVECRHIGGDPIPQRYREFVHDVDRIDFCADSVALACMEAQP